jgi:ribonuclease HII
MHAGEPDLIGFDRQASSDWTQLLAGVDEAGRGCLAGPVTAAAVVLPPNWMPDGLDDSKKLTARKRERLYTDIIRGASLWSAFCVPSSRIDRINILQATMEAMSGAIRGLGRLPGLVLVDGNRLPDLDVPGQAVIGGDGRSAAIAAASIIAKVARDSLMQEFDRRYPAYGFGHHKGYGAPDHLAALESDGPCPIHRFTFRPLSERDQQSLF